MKYPCSIGNFLRKNETLQYEMDFATEFGSVFMYGGLVCSQYFGDIPGNLQKSGDIKAVI